MKAKRFCHILAVLCLEISLVSGCGGGSGSAPEVQMTWVQLHPDSAPTPRWGHAMVYAAGPFIFAGGNAAGQTLGDTWEWDGRNWVRYTPTKTPPGRMGHAMAFDEARQQVVLFGGTTGLAVDGNPLGLLNDTWIWNGTAWIDVSPGEVAPAPRWLHALAYDPNRKKVVLFGGQADQQTTYNDTWEWDGAVWVQIPTPPGVSVPARRFGHAMAFDSTWKYTTSFGGWSSVSGSASNDMFWWGGRDWGTLGFTPAVMPPVRMGHAIVADSSSGRIVLFGGRAGGALADLLNDTWSWDGRTWRMASPSSSPSPRANHAMAFNGATREMFLFGGRTVNGISGDTWVYQREGG